MSNSAFVTDDVYFAAALGYIFGLESLLTITFEDDERRRGMNKTYFKFDAPDADCEIYLAEFRAGKLSITDLMAYVQQYTKLVNMLRNMRRSEQTEWASPSWIAGRG
jgi:hypothetical protein